MTNIISQLLFITKLANTKLARGSEARVKGQRCTTLALLEDHNKISPLIAGASLWAFSSECLHFENVCIFYFFAFGKVSLQLMQTPRQPTPPLLSPTVYSGVYMENMLIMIMFDKHERAN